MQNEAANAMILGLAPKLQQGSAVLITLEENGKVVSAALQTPPMYLALSFCSKAGLVQIADALLAKKHELSGVFGPQAEAKIFGEYWAQATGKNLRVSFNQRLFKIENVIAPRSVKGEFVQAKPADLQLVFEWMTAFNLEALPNEPHSAEKMMKAAESRIVSGELYLWVIDGKPVSMAGVSGQTENGIRVNAVYSPPEYRGYGYASAVTYHLTKLMLESGRKFCCLYTDLANPTSNGIYTKLGYAPVLDSTVYLFE